MATFDVDAVARRLRQLLNTSPEVTRSQTNEAVALFNRWTDDPVEHFGVPLSELSLEFLVDHALEDAGVPREDRLAITDEIVAEYGGNPGGVGADRCANATAVAVETIMQECGGKQGEFEKVADEVFVFVPEGEERPVERLRDAVEDILE